MNWIIFLIALIPGPAIAAETTCASAKEFITTYEFLKMQSEYGVTEQIARETAEQVALGCNGSAKRFISTYSFLMKVEFGARSSLDQALRAAQLTDHHAETFIAIFKQAYLAEYLDLDLSNSLALAQNLSFDYSGDVKRAKSDFAKLTEFCIEHKNSQLPPAPCGALAGRVAKAGESFSQPMAPAFIRLFNFLREHESLKLPVSDSARITEAVIRETPAAADNFISAYLYAEKESGLKLAGIDALRFARRIAKASITPPSPIQLADDKELFEPLRKPAGQTTKNSMPEPEPESNSTQPPEPAN